MSKITENLLILVDGSSYLYRAYYAFPHFNNSAGEPTGAIYGVINMLKSLMMRYQPNLIGVVFDTQGKTFRDQLFNKYKSKRQSIPDKLLKQIAPLHEIVSALGIPILTIPGVEADDIIGTLALHASKNRLPVLISTIDKDLIQLVSTNITLINTMTNTVWGLTEVMENYGVTPNLIVDLLALMGDTADNIPGIPGVGKKTALALIHEIGDFKTIYNNLSLINKLEIRGAKTLADKMVKYKDIAFLSYKLAMIKTNIHLVKDYDSLLIKEPDINKLYALLNRYEFNSWLSDLNKIKEYFTIKKNNK